MIFNMTGGSGGSGGVLTVTAPANVTVTVNNDKKTYSKKSGDTGVVEFKGLDEGIWSVTISDGDRTSTIQTTIVTGYSVDIAFAGIPEFTYSGTYAIVDDNDNPITETEGNWKIRFLTSGTLNITNLKGAQDGIDVFLVGGGANGESAETGGNAEYIDGGRGGCGGKTNTVRNKQISANTEYEITIGGAGSTSSAFGESAAGGTLISGGSGGGGGSQGHGGAGAGGSDGSNGKGTDAGSGQGTTTREFGEDGATLYAGGGGGGAGRYGASYGSNASGGAGGGATGGPKGDPGYSASANTGGGGGGGGADGMGGGKGGSGIVIIRNKRG